MEFLRDSPGKEVCFKEVRVKLRNLSQLFQNIFFGRNTICTEIMTNENLGIFSHFRFRNGNARQFPPIFLSELLLR